LRSVVVLYLRLWKKLPYCICFHQSGEKETGCTVHIMTNEVDKGSIIIQKKCQVKSNDTPELLKQRVQDLEGIALTETLYYAYNNLLVNMENKKFIGIVKSIEI